jgi:hypothetical protein
MDLIQNWRAFQDVFFPAEKQLSKVQAEQFPQPILLIQERGTVVAAFSSRDESAHWVGRACGELMQELGGRDIRELSLSDWRELQAKGVHAKTFWQSTQHLKKGLPPDFASRSHFLLEQMVGGWNKILPHHYMIYLELSGAEAEDSINLLIGVKGGQVEELEVPDFSSLSQDARMRPSSRILHLKELHKVPVQGILTPRKEWNNWALAQQPWRAMARSLRERRVELVPFRMPALLILATRAFLLP